MWGGKAPDEPKGRRNSAPAREDARPTKKSSSRRADVILNRFRAERAGQLLRIIRRLDGFERFTRLRQTVGDAEIFRDIGVILPVQKLIQAFDVAFPQGAVHFLFRCEARG